MRHGFKKPKFGQGYDAGRALMRKLTVNFLMTGKIKTTIARAKAVRPEIEKLVGKIKSMREADKNNLLNKLGNVSRLEDRFKDITTALSTVKSGYTRIVKLGRRQADGSEMGELTWAYPVVLTDKTKKESKVTPNANKK